MSRHGRWEPLRGLIGTRLEVSCGGLGNWPMIRQLGYYLKKFVSLDIDNDSVIIGSQHW